MTSIAFQFCNNLILNRQIGYLWLHAKIYQEQLSQQSDVDTHPTAQFSSTDNA